MVTANSTEKGKEKVKRMEKLQVLGYRNFKKKSDGTPLTVITVFGNCTPADNSRGQFGMKASDLFLPDDKVGTLTPDCVGKEFIPEYGFNSYGRPQLIDFAFKEWKA